MQAVLITLWVAAVVVCFVKDKPGLGMLGMVFPLFAWVGSIRVAKPGSYWDTKNYPIGSSNYQLARNRFPVDTR